jgi:hypothetical protein
MNLLVVCTYDRRWNCIWQVIERSDLTVIASYRNRKDALERVKHESQS